ncbi:MAG: hypothetical protein OFPII_32130 [Osedax symbiont Rs1]|nr:MAG: hypothetical protein OFPII_32130 [Osedax symbiont Rs1]
MRSRSVSIAILICHWLIYQGLASSLTPTLIKQQQLDPSDLINYQLSIINYQ